VETEAYRAVGDKACHTFKRPSARDFVAAHQAGDAYVYLSYGMHWLFNILIQGPQAVDLHRADTIDSRTCIPAGFA